MLVNLHIDQEEVKRVKEEAKSSPGISSILDHIPTEKGMKEMEQGFYNKFQERYFYETQNLKYEDEFFNSYEVSRLVNEEHIPFSEVAEKHPRLIDCEYGVADNIEQIKKLFADKIADPDTSYAISLSYVEQHKENAGKGGGWRWHKWGPYIGELDHQCEYLDDEEFGPDFQGYVICFHIKKVHPENWPGNKPDK